MKHFFLFMRGAWAPFPVLSICLGLLLFLLLLAILRRNAQLRRAVRMHERHSQERLRLLRSLLELCYSYRESPQVFLDKFKDRVNFCQLKNFDLFESENRRLGSLKEDERFLFMLLDQGFSQRELCVIFNLKKASYLYIKYKRIRKRLEASPDTL